MTLKDDLRFLATIDTHHKRLSRAGDAALERYTIKVQRRDGQPVVAIAMQAEVCPVAPLADWQIVFCVVDIRLDSVVPELGQLVTKIRQAMAKQGKQRLWGMVANEGTDHLKAFLDPLADKGLVTRIAGEDEYRLISSSIDDRDTPATDTLCRGAWRWRGHSAVRRPGRGARPGRWWSVRRPRPSPGTRPSAPAPPR